MKKKENILLLFCMTFVCYTYGQSPGPPPPPPPPPNLPVDGGLFFLIALAIIYGVKKTRN
jgi:hypothetical protein